MPTNREELRQAVHLMLHDVIEQGFHLLVYHPQHSDTINGVIQEAGEELHRQLVRVEAGNLLPSSALQEHYDLINRQVHRSSLALLARLQKIHPPEVTLNNVRSGLSSGLPA